MDNLTYLLCVSGLSPYYIEIIVMHELIIRNASARSTHVFENVLQTFRVGGLAKRTFPESVKKRTAASVHLEEQQSLLVCDFAKVKKQIPQIQ